jgi:hypothetical protein
VNLGKTIEEVRSMPLDEFQSWAAYDRDELLPDKRIEIQLAQIAHILAASNSRNPSSYRVSDFMPSEQGATTPDDFLRRLRDGR